MIASVKCPYCGTIQKVCFKSGDDYTIRPQVVGCDNELGGCDRYFAVMFRLTVNTDVYTLDKAIDYGGDGRG